jgi:hypothetical protein
MEEDTTATPQGCVEAQRKSDTADGLFELDPAAIWSGADDGDAPPSEEVLTFLRMLGMC